jgi:hypothetical protein
VSGFSNLTYLGGVRSSIPTATTKSPVESVAFASRNYFAIGRIEEWHSIVSKAKPQLVQTL